MNQNWIVENLNNAFSTWNGKLTELWGLVTTSPQSFKGGAVWGVMQSLHSAMVGIGYALIVLFFAISLFKNTANFHELKRPEAAVHYLIRFVAAKALVGYGMDIMLNIFSICNGIVSDMAAGMGGISQAMVALPGEVQSAIENVGFLASIPLWLVTSLGSLFITVLSFVMILTVYVVILILIDLTEKNNLAQEQQKTLNEQLRSQRANIDALSSAYATQRKMTHDFRHHIAALSGMLQGGETQQAQDYLAALQEQQTERALMVNTHNSAIDAVLNQKGYAAQKQHIDIQFEVNDLSPLQIELIDCTVVLGNLLDNAIEACLKLEEAKRRIEVSVLRDEAYADGDAKLYVSIINTSLPVHIEKDCIATTKLEPHLHGFGLPCAKELLRRNNAFYTMDYHDGAFQFCFEWPDVACNSCVHA